MKGCLMNHFKCPYNPLTCDHSVFFEGIDSSKGKTKKWVECVECQYSENPVTKKMRWSACEEFTLVADGVETIVKKGDLCVNSPVDWWEEYKDSSEKGIL
jgi:hypothetical protein